MPRITGKQIAITLGMVLIAALAYLPAGSANFRASWMITNYFGIPGSAWLMLGLIVAYLIILMVISAATFSQQTDTDDGASS